VGKQVQDDAAEIGLLQMVDDVNRVWYVATTSQVVAASVMTITAGAGAGTSEACTIEHARQFVSNGDYFTLGATPEDEDKNDHYYVELDVSDFYSSYVTIRFRTSVAIAGMGAYAVIVYDDADTQNIDLGYSTDWKTTTTVLDHSTKAVSKIRLYAYKETVTNGDGATTYYVYYDYTLFHASTFTFPHVNSVLPNISNKIAQLEIPGRDGDILQHLGMKTAEITVNVSIIEGETWRSANTEPDFNYLLIGMSSDTWSYFTNSRPLIRCQVMYKGFTFGTNDADGHMTLNLHFLVYKLGSYSLFSDYSWIWGKA